jgi:hypothetical protein
MNRMKCAEINDHEEDDDGNSRRLYRVDNDDVSSVASSTMSCDYVQDEEGVRCQKCQELLTESRCCLTTRCDNCEIDELSPCSNCKVIYHVKCMLTCACCHDAANQPMYCTLCAESCDGCSRMTCTSTAHVCAGCAVANLCNTCRLCSECRTHFFKSCPCCHRNDIPASSSMCAQCLCAVETILHPHVSLNVWSLVAMYI